MLHLSQRVITSVSCAIFLFISALPLGVSTAQAQQLNKVAPEVKKQAKVDYHGEDMEGKDGPLTAVGFSFLLPFQEYQSYEHSNVAGLPMAVKNLSPKDWTIRSRRDDYVRNLYVLKNLTVQGFEKVPQENTKANWSSSGIRNGKNHVFIKYKFGGGEEYSRGDVVGYGAKIEHTKKYKIEERVLGKRKGQRYVIKKEVRRGCVGAETFEALKSKVDAFISGSPPKRFPDDEVNLEGPAKSLTLKIRPSPTGKQSVFRAHMGGSDEYYPESFLSLIEKLNDIIYSNL